MRNEKQRTNRVGVKAFAHNPDLIPAVSPALKFPNSAVLKRVPISRPMPEPVRRICPYCGCEFDDYTQRWNTVYDRPSCGVGMSKLKKRTAIDVLMLIKQCPEWIAAHIMERDGLAKVESVLNEAGYHFEAKKWLKRP